MATQEGKPAPPLNHLTVQALQAIIRQANQEANSASDKKKPKPRQTPTGAQPTAWFFVNRDMSMVAPMNKYDEVFPGIFLGDESFARDKKILSSIGITHLLNAAQGQKFNQIDTSEAYYGDLGLKYMGVKAMDIMGFKMAPYFRPAAQFIHDCLQSGGKVAVHCHMGRSRSASLVLAYLMIHHSQPLGDALRSVCLKRSVFPNDGFLKQLIALEKQLRPSDPDTDTETVQKPGTEGQAAQGPASAPEAVQKPATETEAVQKPATESEAVRNTARETEAAQGPAIEPEIVLKEVQDPATGAESVQSPSIEVNALEAT